MINPGPAVLALAVNFPDVDAVGVALVALGGHIVNPVRFHTVRAPSMPEVVNIVSAVYAGMVAALPAHFHVVGIGVAVPGLVDPADGTVIEAPRLGWREQPLAAQLAEALALPVACANDAIVGARAQAAFGAGQGISDFVYLFRRCQRHWRRDRQRRQAGARCPGVRRTAGAYAGADGAACSCGSSGCLEAEVTREELLRAVSLPADQAEDLEQTVLGLFDSGEASEKLREVLTRQARLLAVGLRGVVHQVNPSLIVLGGFLRILAQVMPDVVQGAVSLGAARSAREHVAIELAPLGESPILVGAAELAFEPLLADPAGVLRQVTAALS